MKTYSLEEIISLITRFEAQSLPKVEWTHEAHLVVAVWYNLNYDAVEAMRRVRRNITAHNESVGTPNTDTEGYHETITVFWMKTARAFIDKHASTEVDVLCNDLIASDKGKSSYPLEFYSREVLFSVKARHEVVEQDQKPLTDTMNTGPSSIRNPS